MTIKNRKRAEPTAIIPRTKALAQPIQRTDALSSDFGSRRHTTEKRFMIVYNNRISPKTGSTLLIMINFKIRSLNHHESVLFHSILSVRFNANQATTSFRPHLLTRMMSFRPSFFFFFDFYYILQYAIFLVDPSESEGSTKKMRWASEGMRISIFH